MAGREDKKENDLFYTCSLIEYIGRKTKNHRAYVADKLGRDLIAKIYDLADVYHSDNIESVSDDFIRSANIASGNFDNISAARYSIPSHWDIGKVYKRLIIGISKERNCDIIDAFFLAYHSPVAEKIEDYNSSFYYESPQYILNAFLTNILE